MVSSILKRSGRDFLSSLLSFESKATSGAVEGVYERQGEACKSPYAQIRALPRAGVDLKACVVSGRAEGINRERGCLPRGRSVGKAARPIDYLPGPIT